MEALRLWGPSATKPWCPQQTVVLFAPTHTIKPQVHPVPSVLEAAVRTQKGQKHLTGGCDTVSSWHDTQLGPQIYWLILHKSLPLCDSVSPSVKWRWCSWPPLPIIITSTDEKNPTLTHGCYYSLTRGILQMPLSMILKRPISATFLKLSTLKTGTTPGLTEGEELQGKIQTQPTFSV